MVAYYQNRTFRWKWIYRGYARWTWVSVVLFFHCLSPLALCPANQGLRIGGYHDRLVGIGRHVEKIQSQKNWKGIPFIFSWGHKTASELQFYLKGHPATFAQTVLGKKALAYDYWFDPKPLQGRDALFVWSDFEHFPDEKSGLLEKYFTRVEEDGTLHRLSRAGIP